MRRVSNKIKNRLHGYWVRIQEKHLEKLFHKKLSGVNHCYISQNCIGGRFYQLQGRRYTSPTVGLWIEPSEFLEFCENLQENLGRPVLPDLAESQKMGYPVGRINGLKILFQHYLSFEEAKEAWDKRASRVSISDVFILMSDRDGFSENDYHRFNSLPTKRKMLFSHKSIRDNGNVVYVPGFENDGSVGELYTSYYRFHQRAVRRKLFQILRRN